MIIDFYAFLWWNGILLFMPTLPGNNNKQFLKDYNQKNHRNPLASG